MPEKKHSRGIPEEKAASREEIDAAFHELNTAQLIRLRNISRFRSNDLVGRFSEFEDDQALLKMTFLKLFSGERKWNKEKVDLFGLLVETMRSIADHARKHLLSKNAGIESQNIQLEPNEKLPNPVESIATNQPNSENCLFAKQSIEKIEDHFSEDSIVLEIIDGLRQELSGSEIREILGLSTTEYETARKRLLRGSNKLRHEGKLNA